MSAEWHDRPRFRVDHMRYEVGHTLEAYVAKGVASYVAADACAGSVDLVDPLASAVRGAMLDEWQD